MKRMTSRAGVIAVAVLASMAPAVMSAQDSLRILHVRPALPASPVEPVVIDFDHPVAPRLDASIDPARVLRITPAVGARVYWRDPSTIVADFDSAWAAGARYEVRIDATLRSASGLPLAHRPPIVVHVRMPRLLQVFPSANESDADTVAHPVAVFDGVFDLRALANSAWFVPQENCRGTDSLALRTVRIRRISATGDSWQVREAGGYERDRRLDSLRRVVEFDVVERLARGCTGEIRLPKVVGDSARERARFAVRASFRAGVECLDDTRVVRFLDADKPRVGRVCDRGAITIAFSNPTTADEVRAHVLVDGKPARVATDHDDSRFALLDSIQAKRTSRITIRSTLRNTHGERLAHDTTIVITGNALPRSVGYASGQVLVPRDAPTLVRLRHVNTDSVTVVIARIPDSLRSEVLRFTDNRYSDDVLRWEQLVRDTIVRSVATRAPADNERVTNIPTAWIPVAWRNDPLLLVRAMPVRRSRAQPKAATEPRAGNVRGSGGARMLAGVSVEDISAYSSTPRFAVVHRSNIAVHVVGAPRSAEVWVTSLREAQPRAGAVVRMLDDSMRAYGRAVTDARGRATLRYATPQNQKTVLHIEADADGDRALLMMDSRYLEREVIVNEDSLENRGWYGATTKIDERWLHGSAFTERGIYRPGERVYLGGAVRTFTADSGYRTPSGDSARWSIWHERERVWSHVGRLSDFGALADSFPLARSARLGHYVATLALRAGGAWRTAGRASFQVAEYRAPEFAVRLDADSATPLFAGDTARVRIGGRYLFGLPMDGGAVHWWWGARKGSQWELRVPGLERYTVGRSEWRLSEERRDDVLPHSSGNVALAANGTFTLAIPTLPMGSPGSLDVNVTVTDASRQAVTSQLSLPLHSADAYVGMRTRERRFVWRARDSIAVELLVVRANGTPRVGDAITVVAQRTRWINARTVRDTAWRTTLTSAAAPVLVTFRPGVGGSYELLASVADEKGRGATTGLDIWVAGGGEAWAQRDPRQITLRSDRTKYAPGDEVSLVVESPAEQRAWVSLRREGVLYERLVDLHVGVNEVRVPVPMNAAPSAEIRVIAIRPYGAQGSDSAGIYVRWGALTVEVDTTARSLLVVLTPERTRYRPGDTVRVSLNVRDAAGKAARSDATVWAVDQGVVSLTAFVRPAVLAMLMAAWGDYPWQGSTLLAWMRSAPPDVGPNQYSLGSVSNAMSSAFMMRAASGGAPGIANDRVRRDFMTTPFFTGGVRTDGSGRATVSFTLPDNVGTFRLYGVAVGTDVWAGSGDTSIISTKPLLVRPALPRIVRIGDTLFAGAAITQEAASRTPVTLSIATTNVLVRGAATLTDTLDAQRAGELRFPLIVTGGDSVTLTFRGTTTGAAAASDAVEARLPVSPPGRARAHVVTGLMRGAEDVSLSIPDGTDTVRSHVALQLGVSALPLVRQFTEALRIYPYYCTEQVSSAGRALLARIRLQRALGESAAITPGDRAQLEAAVSILLRRQRADGGYGYWSSVNWTSAWLSGYALDFLIGARDVGIAVPAGTLERAKTFLASAFPTRLRTGDDPWHAWRDSVAWPHNAMSAAYMLRRVGVPDTTLERDLWGLRNKLGFEDRLSLAAVYAERADSARSRELLDDAWRSARVEGRRVTLDDSAAARRWLFRSVSRPVALLLGTTARLQPTHPLLGALFESLVQTGRSEQARWWNTLDHAVVAEALSDASRAMALSTPRRIAVSGPRGAIADVVVDPHRADSLRLTVGSLLVREGSANALQMKLTSTAQTPTYYAMTLFEIPSARPVRADDAGIGVERWYESYAGGAPITAVREGELVRVRLRITVPADREFVVVDDALPAGLEAVDLSLRTSASLPPFPGAPRLSADMEEGPPGQRWLYGSWDGGWWTPWEHKEIRDDRVLYFARQLWKGSYQATYVARATTVGTFVRPPAQAEEMYNPAVRGRSDGGTFTVTRAP